MATANFVIGPTDENGRKTIPRQPGTTPIYPQATSAAFTVGPGSTPSDSGSTAGQAIPGKSLQQLMAEQQNTAAGKPASATYDATQAERVRPAGIDARLKNQEANYTYQAPAAPTDSSGFTAGPTATGGMPGAQAPQGGQGGGSGGSGTQGGQSASSLYQTALSKLAADNKVNPYTTEFNESKGVEGRVNSITSSGSPLMQAAKARAMQDANRRGLANSSMAAGAGQMAVLNAATPIATADAGLYQQQGLANQDARNSIALANAQNAIATGTRGAEMDLNSQQFGVTSGQAQQQIDAQREQFGVTSGQNQQQIDAQKDQFGRQLGENSRQFDTEQSSKMSMFDRELTMKAEQMGLDRAQAESLAGMERDLKLSLAQTEADFKNEIQSSANISNAWTEMMRGIAQIQGNPDLDESTKADLINNNLEQFKSFSAFWSKTTNVDVSDLLAFGSVKPATGQAPDTPPTTPGEPANFPPSPGRYPGGSAENPTDTIWSP